MLAIYFFAYGSVKLFALELIVGVAVGTYSSVYIASSLVLYFDMHRRKGLEGGPLKVVSGVRSSHSGSGADSLNIAKKEKKPQVQQSAEEIRLATEAKRKRREARRKKK